MQITTIVSSACRIRMLFYETTDSMGWQEAGFVVRSAVECGGGGGGVYRDSPPVLCAWVLVWLVDDGR